LKNYYRRLVSGPRCAAEVGLVQREVALMQPGQVLFVLHQLFKQALHPDQYFLCTGFLRLLILAGGHNFRKFAVQLYVFLMAFDLCFQQPSFLFVLFALRLQKFAFFLKQLSFVFQSLNRPLKQLTPFSVRVQLVLCLD
jgi:hypothetical protein